MAVTAPKCKICGKAHWSNAPHQWAGPSSDAGALVRELVAPKLRPLPASIILAPKPTAPTPRAPESSKAEARKLYMRELMRQKRAEAKAKRDGAL